MCTGCICIVKDGLEITYIVIPLVDIAINDTSRLTAVIFLIIFLLVPI
jgi:hypothetical protein